MWIDACACVGLVMGFLVAAGGFITVGEWVYFRAKLRQRAAGAEAPRRMEIPRTVLDFLMQ
ncbi:MAG: hypothetical protein AB1696_22190 [Planctomycetota bacterium]